MFTTYTIIILSLSFLTLFLLVSFGPESDIKMVVMTFAMANGLSIGLLAGIVFHDNLFIATISSIGLASVLTVLLGIRLGYHDAMEGFYSSMMAAMMGAMLNVMITKQAGLYLLLLSLLCVICVTILELKHRLSRNWTRTQLSLALFVSLALITFVFITFPIE